MQHSDKMIRDIIGTTSISSEKMMLYFLLLLFLQKRSKICFRIDSHISSVEYNFLGTNLNVSLSDPILTICA